jgi:D-aspartate ligase
MMQPGAVVIGGYANGVSVVRGLAREGVRTAVVLTTDHDIAQHSRYAHEAHRVHYLNRRPDGLIDLLEAQRERWRGWALIPTNDYALAAIAGHREMLSRSYSVTVPEEEITRRVLDKSITYRLAADIGVDVAQSYGPATRETAARLDLAFPLVVKPLQSARFWEVFGKKLLVVLDRSELVAAVDRVVAAGMEAEVLDLVPGPDGNVYSYTMYLDRWGRPAAELASRKLRKAPRHFGVGRASIACNAPELRERTLELLRRIEWRGLACVEYKLDARDGRYRLMEINGRCPLSNALPTRCGINYPLLAWREYAMRQRVSATSNGWPGVWTHMHADLLYTAMEKREPDWSWREFAASYAGPWVDAVWSSKDPLPFLAQWAGTFGKATRSVSDSRIRNEIQGRFHSVPAQLAGSR